MEWCRDVVLCTKPLQEVSESLIDEMRPSITYDHSWYSEAWKNDLVEHFSGMLGVCSATG